MKELQERFAAALKTARELNTKADRSDAENAQLETAVSSVKSLQADLIRAQELSGVSEWASKSAGMLQLGDVTVTGSQPAGSTQVNFSHGAKGGVELSIEEEGAGVLSPAQIKTIRSPEYGRAFRGYMRHGIRELASDAIKTLQEGSDTQGGFLVPEDFLSKIIAKEPAPTNLAGRVTNLQTGRDALTIPKVNYSADDVYTTGMRVTWTGEIPNAATTARVTEPVFGGVRIPVHTAMMSMPLSRDMIEDSAFPLLNWSAGKFSETIDLLKDQMIISGSGQGQPAGLLLNPGGVNQPAIVTVGTGGAVTADGIEDLAWLLPPQYDERALFVFKKTTTGRAIAKLKDTNNRYLWGAGLQDSGLVPGIRDRKLIGYDVLFNQQMPDFNAGAPAYSMIFGDLMGYYLLNRVGFSVEVLREVYAETNQVVILGRLRLGGQVAEDWKIKIGQTN